MLGSRRRVQDGRTGFLIERALDEARSRHLAHARRLNLPNHRTNGTPVASLWSGWMADRTHRFVPIRYREVFSSSAIASAYGDKRDTTSGIFDTLVVLTNRVEDDIGAAR
jgi:hypothetical protein